MFRSPRTAAGSPESPYLVFAVQGTELSDSGTRDTLYPHPAALKCLPESTVTWLTAFFPQGQIHPDSRPSPEGSSLSYSFFTADSERALVSPALLRDLVLLPAQLHFNPQSPRVHLPAPPQPSLPIIPASLIPNEPCPPEFNSALRSQRCGRSLTWQIGLFTWAPGSGISSCQQKRIFSQNRPCSSILSLRQALLTPGCQLSHPAVGLSPFLMYVESDTWPCPPFPHSSPFHPVPSMWLSPSTPPQTPKAPALSFPLMTTLPHST